MAALPTGGLKSLTLEDTLLEVVQLLQAAEQLVVPAVNRVSLNINTDTNVASVAATLPLVASISTTGAITFVATEYA